jgi:hypothetical protein
MFTVATPALLTCAAAIAVNWLRPSQLSTEIDLIPNCLLTRYPLLFVTGERSVFYFRNYWNTLPQLLREHGYEVEVLELPWRANHRAHLLQLYLRRHPQQRFHLVGDCTSATLLQQFRQTPQIVSSTMLSAIEVHRRPALPYRLSFATHQAVCRLRGLTAPHLEELGLISQKEQSSYLQQMLRLCISLAEDDARW